jgi:hypothetical protein
VPDLASTVAYLWDTISPPYATTKRAYMDYSNELDILSPSSVSLDSSCITFAYISICLQVMLEPYLDEQVLVMPLNPMCKRDMSTCGLLSAL